MKATIKSLTLQNFKGCQEKTYQFDGKNATVSGANASGKTTILDAFWWCLFNKDSLGNEKFSIRPLDENGNVIHNVEIKVSVLMDLNGREMEFIKTQKEKWVKKRGTDVTELQGNENLYEIDGYPKSEKDYKLAISEIVSEEIFKMITSPTYFPSMKWKDQRDIIMRFVSDVSDYDLASGKSDFAELLEEIQKAPSLDDIKAKYQKALNEWKKKQSEIPVRIDELEKSKVDIDVAELELQRNAISEKIISNNEKMEDVSKTSTEYKDLSNEVMQLKFEESDLIRKLNEQNTLMRKNLFDAIDSKEVVINVNKRDVMRLENEIKALESNIQMAETKIQQLRDEYTSVYSVKFDENSLVCSFCGQEYPTDKKEQIKADFEKNKADKLQKITDDGNETKVKIQSLKKELEEKKSSVEKYKGQMETHISEIEVLKSKLDRLPVNIDVSQSQEYKDLKDKIAEKEMALSKISNTDDIRRSIEDDNRQLNQALLEVERQIAKAEQNNDIDERISQLQAEQREIAQKVADQEKMLYLLEEFIRYKMDKVSETINSMFDGINFKLFENQINGGLKETCEITVNGVPYGSLNNGHRIIAGLQIIKALQKLYGTQICVFIDNAESINDFNLPQMDCQLVLLKVSDDKELVVV